MSASSCRFRVFCHIRASFRVTPRGDMKRRVAGNEWKVMCSRAEERRARLSAVTERSIPRDDRHRPNFARSWKSYCTYVERQRVYCFPPRKPVGASSDEGTSDGGDARSVPPKFEAAASQETRGKDCERASRKNDSARRARVARKWSAEIRRAVLECETVKRDLDRRSPVAAETPGSDCLDKTQDGLTFPPLHRPPRRWEFLLE